MNVRKKPAPKEDKRDQTLVKPKGGGSKGNGGKPRESVRAKRKRVLPWGGESQNGGERQKNEDGEKVSRTE